MDHLGPRPIAIAFLLEISEPFRGANRAPRRDIPLWRKGFK